MADTAANYRAGAVYALATIALLSAQHPFSLPAAQRLGVVNFVFASQVIILCSVPLLLRTAVARRDFRKLLSSAANYKYFLVLLLVGLGNHILYFVALGKAHPITIAAVMNLSPFWAALVAGVVARRTIPTSYGVFFLCLIVAFAGAMLIAVSQTRDATLSLSDLGGLSPAWLFAVPVPILFALSGTLIEKWFADYDEMACIAVTFVTASLVLIPVTATASYLRSDLLVLPDAASALLLLAVGTILGSAFGLVLYQISLAATGNDNGFVSMFFLLGPGLTALLSLALSPWLPQLKFPVGPLFFAGLLMVAIPILVFSWHAQRGKPKRGPRAGRVTDALAR
jgi:drug/metabolite transporter (DMT)-like permease